MKRYFLFFCTLLLWLAPVRAHDTGVLTLAVRLEAAKLSASLTYPSAHAALPALSIIANGEPISLQVVSQQASPDGKTQLVSLSGAWSRLPETLTVRPVLSGRERLLLSVFREGRVVHQELIESSSAVAQVNLSHPESMGSTALRFLREGLHHIASGPDHILFVIGLLLLGGGLRRLLKIVTAFTLAHSITLGVAALGLWTPSSQVIEPLIALSIVCVGVENLLAHPAERDFRPLLALGFGFIHGFGFAGPLVESGLPQGRLALSLLSFNLGVEAGQGLIVVACAPLLALLARRAPVAAKRMCTLGSLAVAGAGLFWFIQRVLAG